jgi:hypothetical protein
MASQTYTVNFLLKLMTKDLLYAQNEAAQCKVDLKTAEVVRSLFETAIEQGLGDKDMASVIEPLRKTLHGVWSKQPTTPLFPEAIAMGATWDPALVHTITGAMSDEARALYNIGADGPRSKHGLVFRSPVINIKPRSPLGSNSGGI